MFNRNDFLPSFLSGNALMLIGAALTLNCLSVSAQERPLAPQPNEENRVAHGTTELEKIFWFCDHAATKGGIDMNQAAACGSITDELKKVMFGGDFDKLLDWWRENKVAQHQRLDAGGGETDASHTAEATSRFPSRI